MAESVVRSLERQVRALEKLLEANIAGGFPRLILTYGDETFQEAMAARGIDYEALYELGIKIRHISLPWISERPLATPPEEAGVE